MYEIYRCLSSKCKTNTNLTEHIVNFVSPLIVDTLIFGSIVGIAFYFYEQARMKRVLHQVDRRLLVELDYFLISVLQPEQSKISNRALRTRSGDIPLSFDGFESPLGSNFVFADDALNVTEKLQAEIQKIISVFASFADYQKLGELYAVENTSVQLHDQLSLASAASLADASKGLKIVQEKYSVIHSRLAQN